MSTTHRSTVVSGEEWLEARKELLRREKALVHERDALNADRRRLPMERIEKDYRFSGPDGELGLRDLFGDRRQLLLQHFMYDPAWDEPCSSCSAMADTMTEHIRAQLRHRNTKYVAVSRAPYAMLQRCRERRGWTFPWFSSNGSDFNYDFHVSLDPAVAPARYNYLDADELVAAGFEWMPDYVGEQPGISCFLRDGDDVFHTYSTFGRGVEVMMPAYPLLDLTAWGRQEEWEEPKGRAPVVYDADPALPEPPS